MAAAAHVTVLAHLPGTWYSRRGPLTQPTGRIRRQDGMLAGTASSGTSPVTVACSPWRRTGYAELLCLPANYGAIEGDHLCKAQRSHR